MEPNDWFDNIIDEAMSKITSVLTFLTGTLRPMRTETNPALTGWYKNNSLIYVPSTHPCWLDEEHARKVRKKRFGRVEQSEVEGLRNMWVIHFPVILTYSARSECSGDRFLLCLYLLCLECSLRERSFGVVNILVQYSAERHYEGETNVLAGCTNTAPPPSNGQKPKSQNGSTNTAVKMTAMNSMARREVGWKSMDKVFPNKTPLQLLTVLPPCYPSVEWFEVRLEQRRHGFEQGRLKAKKLTYLT